MAWAVGRKISAQTALPSGERRQVTVLFADMVGFVEVSERIGEDATFSLIRQIYELLTAAIKDQGGWAKDFTGDGVHGAVRRLRGAGGCAASSLPRRPLDSPAPRRRRINIREPIRKPAADAHRRQLRACRRGENIQPGRRGHGAGRHGQSGFAAAEAGRARNRVSERIDAAPGRRTGRDRVRRRIRHQGQVRTAEGLSARLGSAGRHLGSKPRSSGG